MATSDKGSSVAPPLAQEAVLAQSQPMPEGSQEVKGYSWDSVTDGKVDYSAMLEAYLTSGFQATNFGLAVQQVNDMLKLRSQPIDESSLKPALDEPGDRPVTNCTIFFGFTSNMISSGSRETIRYLVKNNMVDVIVTTAGGVEEDIIKCLGPTYLGDFSLSGRDLRKRGINRIGNLLVPNDNYCKFETWLTPILNQMLEEQKNDGVVWSPSKMISRLGKEIDNPESVYYWAHKNNIPVFCPALTDGSIGDVIYFHTYSKPGLILDIVQDIRRLNRQALRAINSGMIILGGGLTKHHICNANLMRNGADYSVFVNTASEYDGSDSGARPDEAISWGKIKETAKPVKVYADATLILPLLVAQSFAKYHSLPSSWRHH
ncbi:PREDICTED: deoxyhypusine synthase-like [Amphimedon queenslandica]|uniref:deoxyhypusine synthase n=1 Tax=Amphimedon queenslandica TaxID=400682 RepID=A0A1X7UQT3_AMPQE|nr:PREDICTED: deoxyhypusine synthase-like [Amphimedon queenslandica]|eukprot:XP_003387057.1 PREDICTED: deoxyhypusine synthase-like [Amphimedon queenslandica]